MKYDWTDECFLSQKGASKDFKAEWGWTRYLIHEKMFGAVCYDNGDRTKPVYLTLKCEPNESEFLRTQYSDIIPGYYMNKEHWISIKVNGDVPNELVRELIIKSYLLVLKGFSKKAQAEINAQ